MCDRCREIRVEIEKAVQAIEAKYPETMEHHIAQVIKEDPMVNSAELRKAFTSVGPHFHVAMQLGKVAAVKTLEAHNGDTVATFAAATQHVSRACEDRHRLLHMETPSGGSPSKTIQ